MAEPIERDAFGLPMVAAEDDPMFGDLALDTDTTTTGEPVAPEAEAEITPEPTEPVTEVVADEAPAAPAEGAPEEEAPKLYLGKYKTTEDLEKGYRDLRDLQRRTAERANQYEARSTEVEAHARLLEETLQRMQPYLTDYQRQQEQKTAAPPQPQRPVYDEYGQPVQLPPTTQGLSPEQVASLTDQIVSERMQQYYSQLSQEQADAAARAAAEQSVLGFYERHPEVTPRGEVDTNITETVLALNEAWANTGTAVDISDPEALEIAYEASKRPSLQTVLQMNPQYVDSDAGMEIARYQAAILEGRPITQTDVAVPASQVETLPQRKPFSESASSVNPQGTEAPLDEFESAVLEYRKSRPRTSVFGI